MLGISVLRNQHLANIFYRLKLIEAYGTGMLKINECYTDYGLKPVIEVTDHAFKMTLPNVNFHLNQANNPASNIPEKNRYTDSRTVALLSLFKSQDTIVRKDVESALKISQAGAVLLLRELVANGTLIKESSGKYTRYRLR